MRRKKKKHVAILLATASVILYAQRGRGEGGELLTCSYPLNVQACQLQDQRPTLRSGVSGQEGICTIQCIIYHGRCNA